MEFKAHCQINGAVKSAHTNKLYIQKACQHKQEVRSSDEYCLACDERKHGCKREIQHPVGKQGRESQTDQGRLAFWLLTNQQPQVNEYDLLLERHVSPEHTLLNLQAADVLRTAGYHVNLTPPEITLPDGGLFRPDLAMIDDQGATHFVEVERDVDKNLEQRQAKWRNFYQASGGRMYVVCDNRSCMRIFRSEIGGFVGEREVLIPMLPA